jgi:DNA end-binding protein Ku
MRARWSGAVSFGLDSVPVKLHSATKNHYVRFHEVHTTDGGRIRYERVWTVCGEEVDYCGIAKGYESEDGELITLDEADLESLPTASGNREMDVLKFVPSDQVDPLPLDRCYLEPETRAVKPYVLLRQTERMALVKVAIRQRESLAVLRVRDDVTMLWNDEVRTRTSRSWTVRSSCARRGPRRSRPAATARDIMTDLFGALQRSVEAAKVASGDASPEGTSSEGTKASVPVQQTGVKKKAPGKAGPKRTRHTA